MSTDLDHTAILCDPFYELVDPLGRDEKGRPVVQPGQLIWTHQVYPASEPYIVQIQGYDPRDESKSSYVIRRLDSGSAAGTHFPIKELGLRADENYYILLGKKRPAIVLQTLATNWGNKLYPEPYVLAAPAFTFKPRHDEEYRYRIVAVGFPNLFYLPAHPSGLTEDSVLRFEHIQPAVTAGIEPVFRQGKQSILSDTAWAVLQHQLLKFVSGKILDTGLEETIQAYRELVLDAYERAKGQQ